MIYYENYALIQRWGVGAGGGGGAVGAMARFFIIDFCKWLNTFVGAFPIVEAS